MHWRKMIDIILSMLQCLARVVFLRETYDRAQALSTDLASLPYVDSIGSLGVTRAKQIPMPT